MSKEVVETFYGKLSKFTVVKHKETFGGTSFTIEKDGERFRGSFSNLSAAVEAAKEEVNK